MRIREQEVQLKDGRRVLLKSASKEHAEALVRHRRATSDETYFTAAYPEEWERAAGRVRDRIAAFESDGKEFLVTAFLDGEIIGDAGIFKVKGSAKCQHRCGFGISILQEYGNLGLGSLMLKAALGQAKENGFEQVELGVFEDNVKAIRLYEKYGFQKMGRCFRAYKLKDGTYRDEIQMVRVLEEGVLLKSQEFQKGKAFPFLDTGFLEDGEIKLVLVKTAQEDQKKGYLPAYYFDICDKNGQKMGICDLRVGHNANTHYSGNIGYQVEEAYRGRHYAGKACLLLFELAKRHQMDYLSITCNPDNYASRRTCEYAGGVLQGIISLPEWHEMYGAGALEKCHYHVDFR